MEEKPLMTLLILSYNFGDYIEETVRGALAQTYSNLEVVISDDCSKDKTWEVICRVVDEYRAGGGKHRVVLNRNEHNRGFLPHFEFARTLCHGKWIVYNDGDDISHPERVQRIVDCWEKENRQPWVIFSSALKIDTRGRVIGKIVETKDSTSILGGISAYRSDLWEVFLPTEGDNTCQDEVYANRALMLGPRGSISEPLMNYRVGSGMSSGYYNYRRRRIDYLNRRELGSQDQLFKDLERIKDRLGQQRYDEWVRRVAEKRNQNVGMVELLGGDDFRTRLNGLKKLTFKKSTGQKLLYFILLLPHGMADGILALGARLYDKFVSMRNLPCEW